MASAILVSFNRRAKYFPETSQQASFYISLVPTESRSYASQEGAWEMTAWQKEQGRHDCLRLITVHALGLCTLFGIESGSQWLLGIRCGPCQVDASVPQVPFPRASFPNDPGFLVQGQSLSSPFASGSLWHLLPAFGLLTPLTPFHQLHTENFWSFPPPPSLEGEKEHYF